jgi:hypothetical protein
VIDKPENSWHLLEYIALKEEGKTNGDSDKFSQRFEI